MNGNDPMVAATIMIIVGVAIFGAALLFAIANYLSYGFAWLIELYRDLVAEQKAANDKHHKEQVFLAGFDWPVDK